MPGPAPTKADARIGKRIKTAREHDGMTATKLGELVGITRQAIEQYEKGKAAPKATTLKRIADALRLPITWFYEAK